MKRSVVMWFCKFLVSALGVFHAYCVYKNWKDFPKKINQRLRENWNNRIFGF